MKRCAIKKRSEAVAEIDAIAKIRGVKTWKLNPSTSNKIVIAKINPNISPRCKSLLSIGVTSLLIAGGPVTITPGSPELFRTFRRDSVNAEACERVNAVFIFTKRVPPRAFSSPICDVGITRAASAIFDLKPEI